MDIVAILGTTTLTRDLTGNTGAYFKGAVTRDDASMVTGTLTGSVTSISVTGAADFIESPHYMSWDELGPYHTIWSGSHHHKLAS